MCRKHGPIISSVPATPGLNILAVCGHSPVVLVRKNGDHSGDFSVKPSCTAVSVLMKCVIYNKTCLKWNEGFDMRERGVQNSRGVLHAARN